MSKRSLNKISAAAFISILAIGSQGISYSADDSIGSGGVQEDAELINTDWPNFNNDQSGQRFSLLKDINEKNVAELKEICRIELAEGGSLQSGPILVGGVIYVTTALETFALNPANCSKVWKNTRKPISNMPFSVNRGAAYSNGMIIRGTPDGHLIALDSKTGNVVWDNKVADTTYGEFTSMAPLAWQGVVYMGIAGSDWGARGRVMAYDAKTGRELWRFQTIPRGDAVGSESWKMKDSARIGGGGVWGAFSLDIRDNELFVSVGNPAQDFLPESRPGDNLFTNSMVVLDATSGKLKSWYQAAKNDPWDYDLSSAAVLYQSKKDYRDRAAIAGKDGYVHGLDRMTNKLVFKTAVTTQFKQDPKPTTQGSKHCPGNIGGVQWNGPAYDDKNHSLIVGSVDWCFVTTKAVPDYVRGQLRFGGKSAPAPGEKATGWITALDADDGKVKWKFHTEAPVVSGVTPTAGGVTFAGDTAGNFMAIESKSGNILLNKKMDGALGGGIITYAVKGKQYVAITTGNVSRFTFGGVGSPSLVVMGL
jgi:alcohol dehydrogenase (cytochrome c)